MTIAVWFWVLYVLSLFLGAWSNYDPALPLWYRRGAAWFMVWVLIGLLGWGAFGAPIK
jgi:hypothetical protein